MTGTVAIQFEDGKSCIFFDVPNSCTAAIFDVLFNISTKLSDDDKRRLDVINRNH